MVKRVKTFYLISFVYTWSIWILGIILRIEQTTLLISLGGVGPFIASLYYFFKLERLEQKGLIQRFKAKVLYVFFSLLIPSMVLIISVLINLMFTRNLNIGLGNGFISFSLILYLFLLIFGPLPEEIAWRGIAFHELSKKHVMKAQVIVAILWAAWHIPLFYIVDSYQHGLGLFTLSGLLFFVDIISLSFITGFLYINTKSITIAVLFHYAVNLIGEIFEVDMMTSIYQTIIYIIIMVGLVVLHKKNYDIKKMLEVNYTDQHLLILYAYLANEVKITNKTDNHKSEICTAMKKWDTSPPQGTKYSIITKKKATPSENE